MPEEIKRKYMTCVVKDASDASDVVTFRASTGGEDRDGDVLIPEGCDASHYMKNPVFLWAHDWHDRLPIGKGLAVTVHPGSHVDIPVKFDTEDPFAKEVMRKYKDGFLNAVSVGFKVVDAAERIVDGVFRGYEFSKWELLELSGVPIPANADALRLGYKGWMEKKGLEVEVDEEVETLIQQEVESFATDMKDGKEEDRVNESEEKVETEVEAPSVEEVAETKDEEPAVKELLVTLTADMSQLKEGIEQLIKILQPDVEESGGEQVEDGDVMSEKLAELGIDEETALRLLKGNMPVRVDVEGSIQKAIADRVAYMSGKSWTTKN